MLPNEKILKISLARDFLNKTSEARQDLLNELIIYATDPVIFKRRLRMLSQLAEYEAQILKKIQLFELDNLDDFTLQFIIMSELRSIIDRSS